MAKAALYFKSLMHKKLHLHPMTLTDHRPWCHRQSYEIDKKK